MQGRPTPVHRKELPLIEGWLGKPSSEGSRSSNSENWSNASDQFSTLLSATINWRLKKTPCSEPSPASLIDPSLLPRLRSVLSFAIPVPNLGKELPDLSGAFYPLSLLQPQSLFLLLRIE
jgi:hypothetical protein